MSSSNAWLLIILVPLCIFGIRALAKAIIRQGRPGRRWAGLENKEAPMASNNKPP
ncbi:MAG: hypothetical protein AAB729_01310 [Patescibacteria group bacterium]